MIRVLLAGSSAIARAGLEALVKYAENVAIVDRHEDADVVLTDSDRVSEEISHEVPVVLLISQPQPSAAMAALRTGARGVLSADSTPAQIVAAIEAVAAGLAVMNHEDLEHWLGSPKPPGASEQAAEPLTPRETEVLGMMAEGLANKTIAHRLGISKHTIKFHVSSIMSKLNSASRTEAVTAGIRRGLIML